jgi:hypothetical protein
MGRGGVSGVRRKGNNGRMDDCLDLCSDCLADVPAMLLPSGLALCVACAAIRLRVPTLDRAQLLAVLEERAAIEEQARAPV